MRLAAGGSLLKLLVLLASVVIAAQVAQAQTFTTLHSFDSTDGRSPNAPLVQATNGNFYGTTSGGGANGYGTVFKITPRGTLTTLHSFDFTDGASPTAALVQASDGNFYGTTQVGGSIACSYSGGCGTVFKITSSGTLTTLHSFDSTDGSQPMAALIQATIGDFYGTTDIGGTNGYGTVFKITPSGTLTTLHSFDFTDGEFSYSALVQATNGNFYSTTGAGGTSSNCEFNCGTVFKITPMGVLTTLHSFDFTDGSFPNGLIQATNRDFYGTAEGGGTGTNSACAGVGCGTVFEITSSGTLTTLHNFDYTDGTGPAALVQDTNGNFYGTTSGGGANGDGTVFSLSVGLGPFVETQPTFGKVAMGVKILGTNLTGATGVSFNGSPAAYAVRSGSLITATVPAGATTGFVTVTTPCGTLKSNRQFLVRP